MSNGVRYTPTFALPSEYEQQAMEARRRRRMAEMLAAQAYQPQDVGVAPIPTAAPLVQGLQAFLAARQERKAEEAAEKAQKAGQKEFADYIRSFEPEERTVGVGDVAAMEMATPQLDETGRLTHIAPSAVAAPNQRLMPAMTPTGEMDFSQPMQMQVGGPLTMAQRRARALEGFESTNPMVQQFAQAQYAASMPQKRELKIADIDPSKFTPQSIANALKTGDIGQLKEISAPKPDDRTSSIKEYQFAVNQGFGGSFADWERQNRAAGATKIVMPTEGERKDAYNLGRIVTAQRQITQAVAKDPSAFAPGGLEALAESAPGEGTFTYLTQSPARQIVAAAQGDMIDALLTLATGAAYTKEQLAQQRQSYLPRWNESEESKRAKVERLYDLAQQARVRAGRAWNPELDQAIDTAFKPFLEPPTQQPQSQFTPEQQNRLNELERKATGRGMGGPK